MVSEGQVHEPKGTGFPRRVPAMVVYLSPFRIVESETATEWSTTIEQINDRSWDYVQLHEISGGLDVGLEAPYHMLVGRDGALALPPISELRGQREAIEFFNKCIAALLLGGVYCEAVSPDNLEIGSIIDWKYIRVSGQAQAGVNRLHHLLRMRMAPPIDAIQLLDPRTIALGDLAAAMAAGLTALSRIPYLSGEFLAKGVSGIARRDWGFAISNLWITVEQLTAHVWNSEVIKADAAIVPTIEGRRDQLRDTRSWTASLRQELLHQKGIVTASTLRNLSVARKARNDLVHAGKHPSEGTAVAAFEATKDLLRFSLPDMDVPLLGMDVTNHMLTDPFVRREVKGSPRFWMPIPKLPGEAELERDEASSGAHPDKT